MHRNFSTAAAVFFILFGVFFIEKSARAQATINVEHSVTITATVGSSTSSSSSSGGTGGATSGGSGSGGGGGSSVSSNDSGAAQVSFKGFAYPGSIVSLLKDGYLKVEVPASPDGTFDITLGSITQGTYNFAIRAEDPEGRRSVLQMYTVYVSSGITTVVKGIFLPPTVSVDKREVKKGDVLNIFGRTLSGGQVTLAIHSDNELIRKIDGDSSGIWFYKLDTSELELGDHQIKARSSKLNDLSTFSQSLKFKVGLINVDVGKLKVDSIHDLNDDNRIDLVDFSILAYWYKRPQPPAEVDANHDGKIDLVDFSILAYYWTG